MADNMVADAGRSALGDITNSLAQLRTGRLSVKGPRHSSPEKVKASELDRVLLPRRSSIENSGSILVMSRPAGDQQSCMTPLRLHVQESPPMMIIEYIDGMQKGKHSIAFCATWGHMQSRDIIAQLKEHPKHRQFVKLVPDQQLDECLKRLKVASAKNVQTASVTCETSRASPLAGALNPTPPSSTPPATRPAVRRGRSGPVGDRSAAPRPQLDFRPRARRCGGPAAAPTPASNVDAATVQTARAWEAWSGSQGTVDRGDLSPAQLFELFEAFRVSRGVEDISLTFARLLQAATAFQQSGKQVDSARKLPSMAPNLPKVPLDVISTAVGYQQRFARVLWERLQARRSNAAYCSQPLAGRRAVVVGAGPVGLRSALELRLLGAEVAVLERRRNFERINRLHLWPWCAEDLKMLGAKILEPPELSFGADPDFLHIGIGELQMLLLKPCLLLGVQVFFGAEFAGCSPREDAWDVLIAPGEAAAAPVGPAAPEQLRNVSILVGADGPRGSVAKAQSLALQETSGLRRGAALGLVVNYSNLQSVAEKRRRSFSLARQFYGQLFEECEKETGLELENIVCYIAAKTHYFVMTPTLASLKRLGVVAPDAAEGAILQSVDKEALARLARSVVAFRWKAEEPAMPEETLDAPVGAPALFDFSKTRRAESGLQVATAVGDGRSAQMLVGLCGDALIEPFWPEGLGIMRGFFAALDLASAAKLWAETGGDAAAAEAHFEAAYRQLKSLAAKTRGAVLKPDSQGYDLDPSTRYRGWGVGAQGSRRRAISAPNSR